MCELVFFIIPVLEGDEDSKIVCSSYNTHACPREPCAQLVITFRTDAFLRTINVKGGNGRVV